MGWGTTFRPLIFISREYFNSLGELESKIEELKEDLLDLKTILNLMAVATPKDTFPYNEDQGTPFEQIEFRFRDTIEDYDRTSSKLQKLEFLLEFLEENPDIEINSLKS